jgi:beta-glucosidase
MTHVTAPDDSAAERAADRGDALLAALTLAEKASLSLGADFWRTTGVARLGLPAILLSDGPHGLRTPTSADAGGGLGRTRPATCFPTASALGSSWDPDLVRMVGAAIGAEARAAGVAVVLGPGINIKRSPLCGRNFEYFAEDPHVSGVMGAALVAGIQSRGVGACVKHFAANNQETDRARVSADVDERTLREIYLAGFEAVVRGSRPWTVMCAYNRVNGVPASQHRWLLTTVLREEWGFDVLVMSDWGAVSDRVAALAAGLDLEMPPNLGISDRAIVDAVTAGTLDEAVVDLTVKRVLHLVDLATSGASSDGSGPDGTAALADLDAHHALARAAARDCAVLLKNDNDLLPLRPAAGDRVVVVGEFARRARFQGAGSSQVNPTRVDSAWAELQALATGAELAFAPGFRLESSGDGDDDLLAAEAVALATGADVVVAFLGLPSSSETEGRDRVHLELPAVQVELLARLAAVCPRVVVVLTNGSVVRLSGWEHHAGAILECWLAGQASGGAVADLLLGLAAPSGRLAETIPVRLEDCPAYLMFPGEARHVRYGEGVFVGYRGYDAEDRAVSYPFGHGLTYTTFAYSDLVVEVIAGAADADLRVRVSVEVTNTGRRSGQEVVQLYVGDQESSVARPPRELKAFRKVRLEAGESAGVEFLLSGRDLSFWSALLGDWLLEPGEFLIAVGASSRDLRLVTTIAVDTPARRPALTAESTLFEWLADPGGEREIRERLGTDESGRPAGVLGNPDLLDLIGSFPLNRFAAFPGLGLDPATVTELVKSATDR